MSARAGYPAHVTRLGWCALALGLLGGGALGAACSNAPRTQGSPVSGPTAGVALGFLHVAATPRGVPYLADRAGRRVTLRGAAVVGLQDVAYPEADGGPALFPVDPAAYDSECPKAEARIPQPPLCEAQASKPPYGQSSAPASGDDFAQLRALGFNLVRLVLNWSQLEPAPGQYSATYLDRITQVVGWASQQSIYVILDMHQDQYSRYILPGTSTTLVGQTCTSAGGSDGAPAWAVFTDGKPACGLAGQGALNPASVAAFYEFWQNHPIRGPLGDSPGPGLQDHYIGALAKLANTFSTNPTVLGYEIMNEPQPGTLSALPLTNLYDASSADLYPFYRRVVEALTGVRDNLPTCPSSAPTGAHCAYPQLAYVAEQEIVFEPFAFRNLLDFSPQVSIPFSSYPNLVYAPHVYTHAFTIDQFIGYAAQSSPYPPTYTFGYQTAMADAVAMHAAVIVTEYGGAASTDAYSLSAETAAQEQTLVSGSTIWAWKGLSATQDTCWCVRWQESSFGTTSDGTPGSGDPHAAVSPNDQLIASRGEFLIRVLPLAVAGELLAYAYDPPTGTFAVVAANSGAAIKLGDRASETIVSIPAAVTGQVSITGSASLDAVVTEPDGSRFAYVAPLVLAENAFAPRPSGSDDGVRRASASPRHGPSKAARRRVASVRRPGATCAGGLRCSTRRRREESAAGAARRPR
jgi:endoglycosylceramidase